VRTPLDVVVVSGILMAVQTPLETPIQRHLNRNAMAAIVVAIARNVFALAWRENNKSDEKQETNLYT